MNKYEFRGTQGEWHPVEYSGFWDVQDEPYYEAKRLLFYDKDYEMNVATEEEAKANAFLAAAAPDLLEYAVMTIVHTKGSANGSKVIGLNGDVLYEGVSTGCVKFIENYRKAAIHKALNINE